MSQINATLIFVLVIGIIIGAIATRVFMAALWKICGKLVIDTTRKDKDIYTFHVSVPFDELPKYKVIRVIIDSVADKTEASMGEYILYYRGRIFGGVYDDRFLVKPVKSAVAMLPEAEYEIPYKGAKEMLLIDTEDRGFLKNLVKTMYPELPAPKK